MEVATKKQCGKEKKKNFDSFLQQKLWHHFRKTLHAAKLVTGWMEGVWLLKIFHICIFCLLFSTSTDDALPERGPRTEDKDPL